MPFPFVVGVARVQGGGVSEGSREVEGSGGLTLGEAICALAVSTSSEGDRNSLSHLRGHNGGHHGCGLWMVWDEVVAVREACCTFNAELKVVRALGSSAS
jgi:hypothetical protein